MANFFKRLNPNVVFVTIIALIVIAAYIGRKEYLDAKRTLVEAQCAKNSVYQIARGSDLQIADIISFGTITSLCIQSGGVDEYYEWVKVGADEKAKTANAPLNTK
jgi:hypothetical protein